MVTRGQSMLMGERLRALRIECGLSHAKLSVELNAKYGIDISRDSLINYEVSDEHHTKAFKNEGMRIEYLRCISDYYGVSTDWLLGLTDVQIPDLEDRKICEKTGLSPNALKVLERLKNTTPFLFSAEEQPLMDILNALLESESLLDILYSISKAAAKSGDFQKAKTDYGYARDIWGLEMYYFSKDVEAFALQVFENFSEKNFMTQSRINEWLASTAAPQEGKTDG